VSRPTLLLVTGHPQLLYLITRYGEQSGCLVVGAETVDGAVALLGRERPAAVLLHLLPWPDESWEALRRLKASPAANGIPITIISALADEARARDEGAAHWLWQPVMYADFLAALTATHALPEPRNGEL
jgi:putative two-component system response regulator